MKNLIKLSVLALVALFTVTAFAGIDTNWKKINNEDGIKVYRGKVTGYDVVAFKGDAIIDANIQEVMSVLYDMDNKKEWVARLVEAKIVRPLNKTSRIEYNRSRTPWPLSDRDFVYKAKINFNKNKTFAKIRLSSVTDKKMPKKSGIVRGELKESMYTLTQLKNGKTRLTVEILADPKGMLPKWLVNIIQKKWPLKTINGIREQVAKKDFKVHPTVKKLFQTKKL